MASPANIARHLPEMARLQPQRTAIKIPIGRDGEAIRYLALSFAELNAEVAAWQKRLRSRGVRRGDRVLVMVRPGLPLIASVFALFATGAVPVVIDPGMGLKSFLRCVRQTGPRVLLGIPVARLMSRLAPGSFRGVSVRVAASSKLDARLTRAGETGAAPEIEPTGENDLAAILFTSGSTGAPKGVCYEHGMFEAQVRLIRETYGIQPGEIDLPLLPIFALFNPALGMTSIVPEIDPRRPASVDPAKIVRAIQQEGVTNSFGSPTLWSIIGGHCMENGLELPTLKRVLCAGAPVPAGLWRDSARFLPNGEMHSPYGATEALPITDATRSDTDTQALAGADVGRPLPGVEVRIISIVDGPIASLSETRRLGAGEIGEIIVKGPMVTRTYDGLQKATAEAKIADDENGGFWHRMGDTGFLDGSGKLWFCGRKVERVELRDRTLYTEPCERVFRSHPRARRCALVGLGPPEERTAALVVETRVTGSREARELARELRALALANECTAGIRLFYFRDRFPVDVRHNAKIHRLSLAAWAAEARGYASDPKR